MGQNGVDWRCCRSSFDEDQVRCGPEIVSGSDVKCACMVLMKQFVLAFNKPCIKMGHTEINEKPPVGGKERLKLFQM